MSDYKWNIMLYTTPGKYTSNMVEDIRFILRVFFIRFLLKFKSTITFLFKNNFYTSFLVLLFLINIYNWLKLPSSLVFTIFFLLIWKHPVLWNIFECHILYNFIKYSMEVICSKSYRGAINTIYFFFIFCGNSICGLLGFLLLDYI